jgi:hypothetical protein
VVTATVWGGCAQPGVFMQLVQANFEVKQSPLRSI